MTMVAKGSGPTSPWLKHVYPERFPDSESDLFMDTLTLRLETEMAFLCNILSAEHGASQDKTRSWASSLLLDRALALHREHSPLAYGVMVTTLALGDPATASFRKELGETMVKHADNKSRVAARKGLLRGIMLGWAVGMAGLWLGHLITTGHLSF